MQGRRRGVGKEEAGPEPFHIQRVVRKLREKGGSCEREV